MPFESHSKLKHFTFSYLICGGAPTTWKAPQSPAESPRRIAFSCTLLKASTTSFPARISLCISITRSLDNLSSIGHKVPTTVDTPADKNACPRLSSPSIHKRAPAVDPQADKKTS